MRVDQLSYASVYYPLGLSYSSDQDKREGKTLLRQVEVDAITLKLQTQGHTITSNTATKPTGQKRKLPKRATKGRKPHLSGRHRR